MSRSYFTVLTVSKRTGWEHRAARQIRKQTVQPSEWIIVSECKDIMPTLLDAKVFQAPKTTNPSNLNQSLNYGLRKVKTKYVIFYQDFIDLPEDCFEKLMELADKHFFVTTCTPKYDGTDDTRYLGLDEPRPCRPEEWETNVALAPMVALRELGGFDEELDKGWSWDNVNVALRAEMLGYQFIIDESNRPTLIEHEQTSKLAMETNGERNEKIIKKIREGKKPLKLPYL